MVFEELHAQYYEDVIFELLGIVVSIRDLDLLL